jgi:hypothetical protein
MESTAFNIELNRPPIFFCLGGVHPGQFAPENNRQFPFGKKMPGQKITALQAFAETPLENSGGELCEFTLLPGPAWGPVTGK